MVKKKNMLHLFSFLLTMNIACYGVLFQQRLLITEFVFSY
jgi:hypothetical protein